MKEFDEEDSIGEGSCPMCNKIFSMKDLCSHASYCDGIATTTAGTGTKSGNNNGNGLKRKFDEKESSPSISKPSASFFNIKKHKSDSTGSSTASTLKTIHLKEEKMVESKTNRYPPKKHSSAAPLAERMRPTDFDMYSGQERSLGEQTVIRSLLEDVTRMPSLIVWGPPGCGKTSLANIIATKAKGCVKFVKMSACTCGVSEVKDVVQTAKTELSMFKRRTILFLDEVHRFNKTQQDYFLPHIEAGTITFIGATTENPSFSLNNALLSRCKLISLEKLSSNAIGKIISRALHQEEIEIGEPSDQVTISQDAVEYLTNIVDGDARAALTYLEMLINNARKASSDEQHISLDQVGSAVSRTSVKYDRKGDQHYFMASALQKSIRGSDENAALYWLARMLRGGEDPAFIGRRLVRCASEDIGLADNSALGLAVSAMQGAQLLGKPECDVLLAQCTVYLARASKSHEVYGALTNVYNIIDNPGPGGLPDVPIHLRQGGGKVGQQQGWGVGYSFDLNKVGNIEYLPSELKGMNFFKQRK